MKKIVYLLILSPILFISCKKFLDLPPKNTRVMYTIEDVRMEMSAFLFATLNSSDGATLVKPLSYNGSWMQYPFTRELTVATDLYTNDMDLTNFPEPNTTSTRGGNAFKKEYSENKNWEGYFFSSQLWNQVFLNVGYLNSVLKDLDAVPDYNKKDYEQISGEARVIRAYYLLRLNQLFAPDDKNELGIPFNLDANIIEGAERWKQKDLYKKLIGELLDVLKYSTDPKPSWNIFYNKKVVHAILAQTYLYKGGTAASEPDDYINAEKYAKLARDGNRIESTVDEQFELTTVPYAIVVNKPHKFALIRFSLYSTGNNPWAPWGRVEEFLRQSPTEDLYNLYSSDDIRRSVYFKTIDGKVFFTKFLYTNSHSANDSRILFRFSELLLIEAEALYRQDKVNEARLLLNEFKRSKIPDYEGYVGDRVLEEIFIERRKEFILEEQMNWLDMKRQGAKITRRAMDEEDMVIKEYTLEKDDYRYTLPLPADYELKYNNVPQNPGWK